MSAQNDLSVFYEKEPFAWGAEQKTRLLTPRLAELTLRHARDCPEYARVLEARGIAWREGYDREEDIPFLPARLFKEFRLSSVPADEATRTVTSSGTTGNAVSRIVLDKWTAASQKKALSHILQSFIGGKRLPLLIIDSEAAALDRKSFGARGAGILGFSVNGYDVTYALDEGMRVDTHAVQGFLSRHAEGRLLAFGFTFIVWRFFEDMRARRISFDFGGRMALFHSGGWKKMRSMAVDDATFTDTLKGGMNLASVHNYYGMAEQLGSVYVACEYGSLHASDYSQIVIRSPFDFSPLPVGRRGLIETMSALPWSYPGHALLTEDEGTVLGEDDCPCGRMGKRFRIHGRAEGAELRGCSDVYAS